MRNFLMTILLATSLNVAAQDSTYSVNSYLNEGMKAPNTHHIGDAWLNFLTQADEDFTYNITQAKFAANATLDWHKHSTPQVLIVTEGTGYYQEKGKEAIKIKKGDVIKCDKDVEHWHTSSANSMVSYIAIYGSSPTVWTEKLTLDYYNKIARQLGDK
ncbi:cupin [Roseivirga sp. 4D4]|uniref:cupin domain-containing protein n=1 Tax=Roseivirga sp. 4D4 TaxID=1889784 RepID=UPI000852EB7C|nr:cupin domain-containing protein [Roseivirga sp. 4D4]OEK01096.1 cupin [Roseivirga sp. 4D4]